MKKSYTLALLVILSQSALTQTLTFADKKPFDGSIYELWVQLPDSAKISAVFEQNICVVRLVSPVHQLVQTLVYGQIDDRSWKMLYEIGEGIRFVRFEAIPHGARLYSEKPPNTTYFPIEFVKNGTMWKTTVVVPYVF